MVVLVDFCVQRIVLNMLATLSDHNKQRSQKLMYSLFKTCYLKK